MSYSQRTRHDPVGIVQNARHVKARLRRNVVVRKRAHIDYEQAFDALLTEMSNNPDERVVACAACTGCSVCPVNQWTWCHVCSRHLCLRCVQQARMLHSVDEAREAAVYYCERCEHDQSEGDVEQDHYEVTVIRGGLSTMMNK